MKRLQRRLAWKSMRAEKRLMFFNFVVLALVVIKASKHFYKIKHVFGDKDKLCSKIFLYNALFNEKVIVTHFLVT